MSSVITAMGYPFSRMITLHTVYLSAGIALAVSLLLIPVVRSTARQFGWTSKPRVDRWNGKTVALCGGVGIFLAYAAGTLGSQWPNFQIWSVLLPGVCIFALGLIDDFVHIKPSTKLIGQIMCAALAVNSG